MRGAEGIVKEAVGVEAAAEAVGAVLCKFAAHNRDHNRRADTRRTNGSGACVGIDLAQGISIHNDVAGNAFQTVVLADGGQCARMQHADDGGNAHAGYAAARNGRGNRIGSNFIEGAHRDGIGDDLRARAGGCGSVLLGNDHIHGAGNARRSRYRNARGVGSDEFLGIRVHCEIAARRNIGILADDRAGCAFVIGNHCNRGHRSGTAACHRSGDIVKFVLAQSLNGYVAASADGAAQARGNFILEHQRAGANAHRRSAAAREIERQQNDVVVGIGMRRYIAGSANAAAIANRGFQRLVVDHNHGRSAHARRSAGRETAGDVV